MYNRKALLLNSNYEILSFITERKVLKLYFKGKVDVIANWPDPVFNGKEAFYFPAIIRLKYLVKRKFTKLNFSKKMVFKRDKYYCQYCGKSLKSGQITVDHIIPKSLGGLSTFGNCVASCLPCNAKKGNKTLEQANMKLLSNPITPVRYIHYISEQEDWHPDWDMFVK